MVEPQQLGAGRLTVAYCESVWAKSDAPFHVRLLAPKERKVFGGGLTLMALCGQQVAWDVDVAVTSEQVLTDTSFACKRCREALAVMLKDVATR